MKAAVIGSGFMGQTHAEVYARMPGVELVGVYTTKEVRHSDETRFNTTVYTSFEELISEAKPDVVSICLPTHLHKDYVLKAAKLGVHIICEKPIAPTLSDAREMIEACQRNGVRLFVAHVIRFFPSYQDMSRQIQEKVIGEVGVIHTKRVVGHPGAANSWYSDPAKSGGVIMDLMIHDLDFVRSINGEVKSVYAMQRKSPGIEYALVTLKFDNGAIANLEGLWGHSGPLEMTCEIAGKKGMLRFNSERTWPVRSNTILEDSGAVVTSIPFSPLAQDPYYSQLEHFIECIREGTTPIITPEDAYKALELAVVSLQSAKTAKPIDISTTAKKTALGEIMS